MKNQLFKPTMVFKESLLLQVTHKLIFHIRKGKSSNRKYFMLFKGKDMVFDDENSWDGILASTIFALRATVNTTTQHTPAQLVLGQDSILNTRREANHS